MLHSSSPMAARLQKTLASKTQQGSVVSFTTITNPPIGFEKQPRTIGLIGLDDGSQVLGQLTVPAGITLEIGTRVIPRMKLNRTNEQGLRIYDITYEALAEVREESLRTFPGYILALTGPSGVGKTTISKALTKVGSQYTQKVPILTTRKPKIGDDDEYLYVSSKKFNALKKDGKIVAATNIASTSEKRQYGYRASDIAAIWKEGKIPVVVTEMNLLQGLAEHYGRRSVLSCGLLPPGRSKRTMLSTLLHRLRVRGRDSEESIADRIRNAEVDLAFFKERKDLFDHMLVNDEVDTVVSALQGHVLELQEA